MLDRAAVGIPQRDHAGVVDLDACHRWARLAASTALALRTAIARTARLASRRNQLPIGTRALTRRIPKRNEGAAVQCDEVEVTVLLVRRPCAADREALAVGAVATSRNDAAPVVMRRRLPGVAQRLIDRTGMGDDVGLAVDAIRPHADGGQFAGRTFGATLARGSGFALYSRGTGFSALTLRPRLTRRTALASGALRSGFAALALGADYTPFTGFADRALRAALPWFSLRAAFAGRPLLSLRAALALCTHRTDLALGAHRPGLPAFSSGTLLATVTLRTSRAGLATFTLGTALTRRTITQFRQSRFDLAPQLHLQLDDLRP